MPFVRVPLPLAFQVIIEFNESGLTVQSFRALVQTAVPMVTNRMVSERVPVESLEYDANWLFNHFLLSSGFNHEYPGAADAVFLEIQQGPVGILYGKELHFGSDGNSGRDLQKIDPVLPRIGRYAMHVFLVKKVLFIIHGRNVAHVDPGQGQCSALAQPFEGDGDKIPGRRENDRAVRRHRHFLGP